jgi:CheY-like chemotaxis protein
MLEAFLDYNCLYVEREAVEVRPGGDLQPMFIQRKMAAYYDMPGMDGLSLLSEIKKSWPAIPVMMVTAYGGERGHSVRCYLHNAKGRLAADTGMKSWGSN